MKLFGHNKARNNIYFLRDLNAQEVADHEKYTAIIAEAQNRFNLFRILSQNYFEWNSYVNSLLNATTKHDGNEMLQLDRLLLNYLTCAYTIQEHFKVSFQRRFRKDEAKQREYKEFVENLCKLSWPFAFFLDFRGHVQHCGLGIGEFNREVNATSVVLSITHDAAKLVAENREWPHSKLLAEQGKLDLVMLLDEFHSRTLQHYAGYVVKTFFPELFPAAEFYGHLTEEVRRVDPDSRMFFHKKDLDLKIEGDKQLLNLQLTLVPNDLFTEFGIHITKRNSR
jgi:hypothetical protein